MTRLVGRCIKHIEVKEARCRWRRSQADIEMLAKVAEAHETPPGPGNKKILEREFR